jgi:transcriptional regulator with XRE-family HTH domain
MTQKQLAEMLYVKDSTISNWEQGKREVNNDILAKIANIFGCSIDDLYGNDKIKANISKPRQIISGRDFSKEYNFRYLILKGVYVLLALGFVIFTPNGSVDISMAFLLFSLLFFIVDVVAVFYTKEHIKIYDVDMEKEVKYINEMDKKELNKDWIFKVLFTFFLFIVSNIVIPIIYLLLQKDNDDLTVKIISLVTTILIFTNFMILIVYELKNSMIKKEINYHDFDYKFRLFLRKTLIVIYQSVFLLVYTIILFYGRSAIDINDLWIAILFPPLLVFISHLLLVFELKLLADYNINII